MLFIVFRSLVAFPELKKTMLIFWILQYGFEVRPSTFSAAPLTYKLSKAVDGWKTSSPNTSAAAPGAGWKFPKSSGKTDTWQSLGGIWFTVTSQNQPDRGYTEPQRIPVSKVATRRCLPQITILSNSFLNQRHNFSTNIFTTYIQETDSILSVFPLFTVHLWQFRKPDMSSRPSSKFL